MGVCPVRYHVYLPREMKKSLWMHGCWSLAVGTAFMVGMHNGGQDRPGGGNSTSLRIHRTGVASENSGMADGSLERRTSRLADRTKTVREKGKLEEMFGSLASAASGLDALAEQAMKDPNPLTRRLAFARLLESLTPENAELVRSQLVSLGAEGGEWRDFCYAWGAISGKAAFDIAAASPEPDLEATMTGWAAANPDEARNLLANLPQELEGQRDGLTASVVAGISQKDPDAATEFVLKLAADGNGRANDLMQMVANQTLRTSGPEGAALWSESLPNGPLKGAAMSRIADAFARKNPQGAARWAQQFAAEDYASRTIEQVGGRWAQTDPLAAVSWLENLPAGQGQIAGLRNAFSDWEDRDPAAAGEYLLAMPQSAKRDSAISGFATGYAWQNPQLALTWAQEINDPVLRQSSLTRAGEAYFRTDPHGARSWLETSGLPADIQQRIIDAASRRR